MTVPNTTDSDEQTKTTATLTITAGAPFDDFRKLLPTSGHAVYVLADEVGNGLYVGQTCTPRLRLRRHWLIQPWFHQVAQITLHLVPGELAARRLEGLLTERLQPAHSAITWADEARLAKLSAGQA